MNLAKKSYLPETRGRKQKNHTVKFLLQLNNLNVGDSFSWVQTKGQIYGIIRHHKIEGREYAIRTLEGVKHIYRTR